MITGARGFIGRHVLNVLEEQGQFDVHAVTSGGNAPGRQRCRWHQADLLNHDDVVRLFDQVQPEYLLHLAWYTKPKEYWNATENYAWVKAGMDMAKQFHEHGGRRLVSAGTCAEYRWAYDEYAENQTPKEPATVYGKSKHSFQEGLTDYARQAGLSFLWGRIFYGYGPYEQAERLIPSLILSVLGRQPFRCAHPEYIRDFLYVKDLAEAFVALLESDVTGAVNIASGKGVSLEEMVTQTARRLGGEHLIRCGEPRKKGNDPVSIVADTRRLNHEVGWVPQWPREKGLDETIRWWKDQKKGWQT